MTGVFDINNFRSKFRQSSPALFTMTIVPPVFLAQASPLRLSIFSAADDLKFKIKATSLPSSSIATVPWRPAPGPIRNLPIDRAYEDLVCEVICSGGNHSSGSITENLAEGYYERKFFDYWLGAIIQTKESASSIPTSYTSYVDDIVGNVFIRKYGLDGSIETQYEFKNAYPTTVGNVALSWDSSNTIATFNVSFTYQTYTID